MQDVDFPGTKRFQLVRRIGAGGMGVVYEAIDRERGARVALKTLRTWSADAFLRFKDEFRALQDLQHPNLVSLGELLEEEGLWFFTMELVHGMQFLSWVTAGDAPPAGPSGAPASSEVSTDPWSSREWAKGVAGENDVTVDLPHGFKAADVASTPPVGTALADENRLRPALGQLALGLNALHRARKVHRDIKPSNILVTHEGNVKILDFGVVSDLSQQQWRDDYLVGTVSYMAPEQATSPIVGPAADWYSVGVLLYQALTGRLPFSGKADQVVMMKQALDPSPPHALRPSVPSDLDQLCTELLRIEPRRRPTGREILRRLNITEDDSLPGISITPTPFFVGRQRELQTLREAFDESRQGRPVTLLVHGESGVGKSALVRQFVDRIVEDSTAVVLAGHCYERESVPYKAVDGVIDAMSCYLTALPAQATAQLLPDELGLGLLGQVFPVMRRLKPAAQPPRPQREQLDPLDLRARVFAAVRQILARIGARRPLLLVIDDLQWADVDSLALLAEVLRPPEAPALLLVATLRDALEGETGTRTVRQLRDALRGDVRELRVESLPPGEARTLVDLLMASVDRSKNVDRDAIAREAAGHPLFIDELIRSREVLGEERPMRLEQALWARINKLDRPSRSLLEVVAVAGAPIEQETAASALASEFDPFARQVSMLRSANLVKTTGARRGDAIEPYHDRVRNAVLLHLDQPTRVRWHRRLAVALEEASQLDPDGPTTDRRRADPEALAFHFEGAGETDRAAEYAERAADAATQKLAFDRAVRLYQRALALRPREGAEGSAIRTKLGHALANAGRGEEAARAYLAAIPGAPVKSILDLRRRVAEQLLRSGLIDEGVEQLSIVLGTIGMRLPATSWTALLSLLVHRAQVRVRGVKFRERSAEQIAPQVLDRADVCWSAGVALGMVDTVRGAEFQARGLLLALRAGEPYRVARALAAEAAFAATAGRGGKARAEKLLAEANRCADKVGEPFVLAWCALADGVAAYVLGEFRRSYASNLRARELLERCTEVVWERETADLYTVLSAFYLGKLKDLVARVDRARREADERSDLFASTFARSGLAVMAWLARDDVDSARRDVTDTVRRWSDRAYFLAHFWCFFANVQIDLYAGDVEKAYELTRSEWRALRRSLIPQSVQLIRVECLHVRARAALALAARGGDAKKRLLGRAEKDARALEGERTAYAVPMGQLVRAGVALQRGDRALALRLLDAAARGFSDADMALYAAAARQRLGALSGDGTEVAVAESWMGEENIRAPARMLAMLAPGLE